MSVYSYLNGEVWLLAKSFQPNCHIHCNVELLRLWGSGGGEGRYVSRVGGTPFKLGKVAVHFQPDPDDQSTCPPLHQANRYIQLSSRLTSEL
jgi:hypothetical protein